MKVYVIVDVDDHGHATLTVLGLCAVEPQGSGIVDHDGEGLDSGGCLTFDHIAVSSSSSSSGRGDGRRNRSGSGSGDEHEAIISDLVLGERHAVLDWHSAG